MTRLAPRCCAPALAALVVGVAIVAPRAAHADPSASERRLAREMVDEAIADEKAGKCPEAIETLRQATAILETGEALLHLGECLARTGHLLDAIKTWQRAEDVARRDKDRPTQQALIAKLAEVHGRIPALALQLPAGVTAATVSIDGQALAIERIRVPIELDPGEHTIVVKADGRLPFTKKLTLAERSTTAVSAVLVALTPEGAGAGSGVPVGTWIAGSAALVLAGGGVGAFVAAGSAASEGRAACASTTTCDAGTARSVRQLDAGALALWVGAGVGAGLAVTLVVVGRSGGKPAPSAAALRLRGAPGALFVEGAF